ncbi:MAG: anti-sigma factor [Balneolaceae bacterium]|nr:anti-sigma factor [Balneolaceae bacterium]
MSEAENRFEEYCAASVLGALSAQEEQEFAIMLENATETQILFHNEMKEIAAELALGVSPEAPSRSVRDELMAMAWASIERKKQATIFSIPVSRFSIAASFVLLLTSLGLFFYSQGLTDDLESKDALISEQTSRIELLETEVERKEALLTILEARDVDLILMDGLDVNPEGYGKVVWDKSNGRALLQVANLPEIPTTRDYQLWFILDNQPISAGVFAVRDSERDDFFTIENLANDANQGAFAVSLEPSGGSQQPTGDIFMLGAMN